MNPEKENTFVDKALIDISNLSPTQSKIGTESLTPEQGDDLQKSQEQTRAKLAKFLTYTLAGTIVSSFVVIVALTIMSGFMSGFLVDEKKTSSFDKTSALAKDLIVTILTSQIGLVGTAIGFYFGSKSSAD